MSFMEPRVALTVPEGVDAKNRLEWLLYSHIAVAITKIIILGFAFGFGDLFQCLILFCGYRQHD